MTLVTVATCNLNQWALDFEGNLQRIHQSCIDAKAHGATYRLGPELEICGYGCEDHFLESDTFVHCWESLCQLLELGATDDDLLCDFGMPVLHKGARYNCRVLCRNRKVLMIRPKTAMADSGNYRESRYFTAYEPPISSSSLFPMSVNVDSSFEGCGNSSGYTQDMYLLPDYWKEKFGQSRVPFGTLYVQCGDGTTIGCESCEELWTPQSPHIDMALNGVEIIGNGSGSHHELRKLNARLQLMVSATKKCGGVYLYANQRGCDGGRLYYDGCAMIVCNGQVLAQAKQFDVHDVQTIVATVDLDDVRSYRASIPSFGIQAASQTRQRNSSSQLVHYKDITMKLRRNKEGLFPTPSEEIMLNIHSPEEECCLGPACWLWDFLRRSGAGGFFLPLSGGADSSAVATIVGCMCHLVFNAVKQDPKGAVATECRRVCGMVQSTDPYWVPSSPQEIASYVLHTTYMGTENSSKATENRAKRLGEAVGSYHLSIKIDTAVAALLKIFTLVTGRTPQFSSRGGTMSEDLALQNIQARIRMVTAYLFAQLLPWVRNRSSSSGFLLVLGSANVDEGLRGYMTKYDCSSADLNPIGAISKHDLKRMLLWASKEFKYSILDEIVGAPPTAELRPISHYDVGSNDEDKEHSQTDEDDMGMTYAELSYFGRLRKLSRCGPVSMFRKLCVHWKHLQPSEVGVKVKRFFYYYSVNRHKMCTVTPSYHAEAYSPDDNRFDLRQFLYNTRWTRQFQSIDKLATEMESEHVHTHTSKACTQDDKKID